MNERKISQLDALIYPDYSCLHKISHIYNPVSSILRDVWDQRVRQIRDDKNAVLIYLSRLNFEQISTKQITDPSIDYEAANLDIERIEKYMDVLKNRFILLPEPVTSLLKRDSLLHHLDATGLVLDPQTVSFQAYGEHLEFCVPKYGHRILQQLEIPIYNAKIPVGRLSRKYFESD